jgi:hypothetical protein
VTSLSGEVAILSLKITFMIDKLKEKEFYERNFSFSYSSLNKLLFSPSLFYKEYILKDREVKTDKHLIEGSLLHCLLFEPENLTKKFKIIPGKTPTDNIRKVLHHMAEHTNEANLNDVSHFVILGSLKEINLYQSLKKDEQRLAKILTEDNNSYWQFIKNPIVDVIDEDTLNKMANKVDILKSNKEVTDVLEMVQSDFELDPVQTFCEKKLETDLRNYSFGLKGIVDYYKIDSDQKTITICDLKTTGKTISDFGETVEFYNYWMQAAIYTQLVMNNVEEPIKDYQILFKFIVIDKYDQVYVFDVSDDTLSNWAMRLNETLERANYHYSKRNYTLPYQFLTGQVFL